MITASPLTRSQDRVFILCGIALEPTWPGWKPSVTSSWPAINRMLVATLEGAADDLGQCGDHVVVQRARIHLAGADEDPGDAQMLGTRCSSAASRSGSPPNRSSMSWPVPTGPLMPRSG